ncbi:uncharacterized protein J4E84_011103 [Alternaria hordeiaustralica]|uniref:uncharacterized protein n=1 Tax=Alternaria hordeiaustralica TaxID=1187925 RepID=UPI0020C1DFF6|nr:uncharacterized protein J4E84_011103 [Alternaria hordeiaustralica]KAI4673424.1 hypothetical protein J4E84_011103 [Alternaria hordeiaustralica]
MADPLSIAGSVVGITAAGVQASVKLYALAEKVATASQRVTSIADDISSTCAILNQVRELIIPQPDAQGTLKSVFNTVALNDISHALRRCRSSFTEIETLLRRAFEQVGKRPALRSNIKLSRFEQAKWPFLQPQFDELRNDLRDAKGNLVLMIAVASLALAQRDGRQRPIHETERLDLGSTIVQLQRASTVKTQPQYFSKIPRTELKDSQRLFTSGVDAEKGMSSKQTPMFEMATLAKALPPGPPALETFTSASNDRAKGNPVPSTRMAIANMPQAYDEAQVQAAFINTMPHPSLELSEPVRIASRSSPGGILSSRKAMAHGLSSPRESHLPDQPIPAEPMSSIPSFESTVAAQRHEMQSEATTAAGGDNVIAADNDDVICFYSGFATTYLQGLTTGHGDSLLLDEMELPHASLEKLVKTYTDEGNDPHIAMSELTREQQAMIKETTPERIWKIAYVRLQRNISVSSVFGTLNVETLKWIFKMEVKMPSVENKPGRSGGTGLFSNYSPYESSSSTRLTPSASSTPDLIRMFSGRHRRKQGGNIRKQIPPEPTRSDLVSPDFNMYNQRSSKPGEKPVTPEPNPEFGPIMDLSNVIPLARSKTTPMPDADDESDNQLDSPPQHPHDESEDPLEEQFTYEMSSTLDKEDEAFARTSVKFSDASKSGGYSRPRASEAAEYVDPSTSIPTEYNPDVDAWAAQYTDPSALIPPSMPLYLDIDLDTHAAEYVDPATTAMPDADDESETYETQPMNPGSSGSTDLERHDPSRTPSSPSHSPLLLAQNKPDVLQHPGRAVPLEGMTPFDLPYRVEEFGERDGYLEPPSIPHPGEDESFDRFREESQIYHPRPEWDATSSRSDRTGYNTVRRYKMPDDGMEEDTVLPTPLAEEDGEDIVNELLARWTTS